MAHGTPIAEIGIVQWILHTGATTITINNDSYHNPNAHACLLIPQQLLVARGGSTGNFTIGNKCATLYLDGKPYLQIPYNPRSYLPVSLAHNATASASTTEVKLSVISNNKNITPSPKIILLWNQQFGHKTCSPSNICFPMFIH